MRYVDNQNQIMLQTRAASSDHRYRMVKRGDTQTTVATTSMTPRRATRSGVVLIGTSVQTSVNDVDIFGGAPDPNRLRLGHAARILQLERQSQRLVRVGVLCSRMTVRG